MNDGLKWDDVSEWSNMSIR